MIGLNAAYTKLEHCVKVIGVFLSRLNIRPDFQTGALNRLDYFRRIVSPTAVEDFDTLVFSPLDDLLSGFYVVWWRDDERQLGRYTMPFRNGVITIINEDLARHASITNGLGNHRTLT